MHIQQIQHDIQTHRIRWEEVEQRLQRDEAEKKDLETGALFMADDGTLTLDGVPGYRLTDASESQVLTRFVPGSVEYLKKCPTFLKALNLNHWISQKKGKMYFVRTRETVHGNYVRAILTERYAQYDNLEVFAEVSQQFKDFIPVGLELTDTSFHLRLVQPKGVDVSLKEVEDIVHGGCLICNSETGQGSLRLAVIAYRLKCKNGLVSPEETALHVKVHMGNNGDIAQFFQQAVQKAREQADVLIDALKGAHYERFDSNQRTPLVSYLGKRFKWSKAFVEGVQKNVSHEEASKYGLIQAITSAAREYLPEDRLRYERHAGSVLLLPMRRLVDLAQAEAQLAKEDHSLSAPMRT